MCKKWLILEEAAQYLRCSEDKLRVLVEAQAIPYSPFAGQPLFLPERLDEFLLANERRPIQIKTGKLEATQSSIGCSEKPVLADVDKNRVEAILAELENYNSGNEVFVNSLGRKICKALHDNDYKLLPGDLVKRLGKWSRPKKPSKRNDWAQERAKELSQLLFGEDIDRDELRVVC